jgi:hypothetical protein
MDFRRLFLFAGVIREVEERQVDVALGVWREVEREGRGVPLFSVLYVPEPFRTTTSSHRMPLNTLLSCHISRRHRIAAGSTAKGHSCALDQAIALGSIWGYLIGACGGCILASPILAAGVLSGMQCGGVGLVRLDKSLLLIEITL